MSEKKGLWYNIRQRRKKGLPRLKPGDKNYPKTLDIGEEVELDEANHKAADELMTYAKKYGGIDKKDFMKSAGYLNNFTSSGSLRAINDLVKLIDDMDTDPRDKVLLTIRKHDPALFKTIAKKAGLEYRTNKISEEVPSGANTASIPNPADTAMGPKFKAKNVTDRRRKKEMVLLKRFKRHMDEN